MARNRSSAAEQARQVAEEEARRRRVRQQGFAAATGAITLVAVVVVAMVLIRATGGDTGLPVPAGSAAATVTTTVTSVPAALLDTVGRGAGVNGRPKPIRDVAPITAEGKPFVLYVGAEYCPFCASQRWAVVIALSRFGRFSDLRLTRSASDDAYPNTQTLSFHGSSYSSDYLSFRGVETAGNVRSGGRYPRLDRLTSEETRLVKRLNAPPYVSKEDGAGAIPFLIVGNRYIMSGSGFSPGVLAGKSAADIAQLLLDPATPVSRAVLGLANALTTAICTLTDNRPTTVCDSTAAKAYAGGL